MFNQNSLIYPTIDLFLYDLKAGLGENEDKIELNRKEFWQKIYGANIDNQKLDALQKAEQDNADYLELLGNQKTEKFPHAADGYYYPLQLDDTYALQVDCTANFIADYKSQPQPITCLKTIQKEILNDINHQSGKLGQSWLIWGQLATDNQDVEQTAKECFEQLDLPVKGIWKADLTGEFFGATVFELWQLPSKWQKESDDGYHVLICLFPYHLKLDAIGKINQQLYPQLLRLFRYRHKILWAYAQSRQLKDNLKKDALLVQAIVTNLNLPVSTSEIDVNKLQNNLAQTPEKLLKYTNNLTYIDDQRRTIKINLSNYNKRWQKLQELDINSNWDFLQEFSNYAQEKFLEQIESDQANLTPELKLLENTINTIQGIIDIERSKRERTLNTTIGVVGVGLATSQIASAVILAEIPKGKNPLAYQTQAFFLSLFIGAIFAVLTLMILKKWRRK